MPHKILLDLHNFLFTQCDFFAKYVLAKYWLYKALARTSNASWSWCSMSKTAKSTRVVFVNKFSDSSLIGMVPRDAVNEYWWIAYLWNDALFIKKGSHGKCNARSYISQRIRSTREEDWPELKIWVFTSFCSLAAFLLLGYEVKANRGNGLTFIKPRPPSVPIQVGLANQALDWSQIFRSTKHTYCQVFIVF